MLRYGPNLERHRLVDAPFVVVHLDGKLEQSVGVG